LPPAGEWSGHSRRPTKQNQDSLRWLSHSSFVKCARPTAFRQPSSGFSSIYWASVRKAGNRPCLIVHCECLREGLARNRPFSSISKMRPSVLARNGPCRSADTLSSKTLSKALRLEKGACTAGTGQTDGSAPNLNGQLVVRKTVMPFSRVHTVPFRNQGDDGRMPQFSRWIGKADDEIGQAKLSRRKNQTVDTLGRPRPPLWFGAGTPAIRRTKRKCFEDFRSSITLRPKKPRGRHCSDRQALATQDPSCIAKHVAKPSAPVCLRRASRCVVKSTR